MHFKKCPFNSPLHHQLLFYYQHSDHHSQVITFVYHHRNTAPLLIYLTQMLVMTPQYYIPLLLIQAAVVLSNFLTTRPPSPPIALVKSPLDLESFPAITNFMLCKGLLLVSPDELAESVEDAAFSGNTRSRVTNLYFFLWKSSCVWSKHCHAKHKQPIHELCPTIVTYKGKDYLFIRIFENQLCQ